MGADLYRDGYEAIQDANRPELDRALAARNAAFDRARDEGRLTYKDRWQLPPDVTGPDYAVAAQRALDAVYDAMNPPTHYFRDSYNNSSLFSLLGLSWWQDLEPLVGPNGDGRMTTRIEDGEEYDDFSLYPAGMRRLIEQLEQRGRVIQSIADNEDREYFAAKLSRLTAFLHDAAEAGDTIRCSV